MKPRSETGANICAKCGKNHVAYNGRPGCAGHKSSDPNTPCSREPIKGATVCATHGGRASQVRAAAERAQAEATAEVELRKGLAAAYGDDVPDIDPAEAMLQAVSWKYAEVVALRWKVGQLDDDELTWGRTREKTGGDDHGTTKEARPNIWWSMLRSAEDQLVKFAAAARAAGCDERRVQIAKDLGRMLEQAMRVAFAGQLAVLEAALRDDAESPPLDVLRRVWEPGMQQVVPAAFRQIGAGS